MLNNNREAYREIFFNIWEKHKKQLALDLEETKLLAIILEHPELQRFLDDRKTHLTQEYTQEENPFIHLSLHSAVREQIHLDRPVGIKKIYEGLLATRETSLEVEHEMMLCLSKVLMKAHQTGEKPDENEYLQLLRTLERE